MMLSPINDGFLRSNIKKDVTLVSKKIEGKVYVNKSDVPYIVYVYYGTGKYSIGGGSGKDSWYVPTNKISKDMSKYNYPIKVVNGVEYYVISGQKPKQFLSEAINLERSTSIKIIKNELKGV